jgi:hypothetical protein
MVKYDPLEAAKVQEKPVVVIPKPKKKIEPQVHEHSFRPIDLRKFRVTEEARVTINGYYTTLPVDSIVTECCYGPGAIARFVECKVKMEEVI